MIFDTHCHYNLSPLYENWEEHWQKAQKHGVKQALIPSSNMETSRRAIEIAREDKNLYAAIGIHPNEYDKISAADLPTYIYEHAASLAMMHDNENVIAIGETGLDYYRLKDDERELATSNQKEAFKMHIQLANEFDKILIIHARDKGGNKDKNNQAYPDILKIVKDNYQFKKPFILHCVSGPLDYIQEMIDLGAYIGVGGNVTYPNANELREIVKLVPEDKLLLETDAPYLPTQEFRGQTCEPWMISKTAQYLQTELNRTPHLIDLHQ
jgi:TatD DNase family protein